MADVHAARHDVAILNYFDDVVSVSITSLDKRLADLEKSEDDFAPFWVEDMRDVRDEALKAFALSIQSIWERQFRAYVAKFTEELASSEISQKSVQTAKWEKLCDLFKDYRGISMEEFPSYYALDDLQKLGNVCRHGNGPAAKKLFQSRPEIWLPPPEDMPEFGLVYLPEDCHNVDRMDLSLDYLKGFVWAIAEFWKDIGYIYRESIERKHPVTEKALVMERESRTWIPKGNSSR